MQEEYFSPAQLADLLGVTRETIYNGIKSGAIPSFKFGRLRRISSSQIDQALRGRKSEVIR